MLCNVLYLTSPKQFILDLRDRFNDFKDESDEHDWFKMFILNNKPTLLVSENYLYRAYVAWCILKHIPTEMQRQFRRDIDQLIQRNSAGLIILKSLIDIE